MNKLSVLMMVIQLCVIESVWSLDEARNNHGGLIPNELVECDSTSRARVTNINQPDPVVPGTCTYNIKANSLKYCQIRVTIIDLSLADPDANGLCDRDSLQIGTAPDLCGSGATNNMHVMQDFPDTGMRQIPIVITTIARPGAAIPIPDPAWNLRVEQIKCHKRHNNNNNNNNPIMRRSILIGGSDGRLLGNDEVEIEEDVMDDESLPFQGRNNHNGNGGGDDDGAGGPAPAGCLQYFTRRTGTVESFNFNNGRGTYLANMKYAICFQRRRGDTAIQFTPSVFQMAYAGTTNNSGLDTNCYSDVATSGRSEDYLYIPFGVVNTTPATRGTRFCGTSLASTTVTSNAPGPFVIYFNSDSLVDPNKPEVGFRLQYRII